MEPGFFTSVKFKKLTATARMPTRAYQHDAGADFYADQTVVVGPGEIVIVPTGIAVAVPAHTVGKFWDRSSMALRGFRVGGGVIDSGFTNGTGVILQNMTAVEKVIEAGQKIAQMVILPIYEAEFEEVESLDRTDRGNNGLGSSGV